MKKTNVKFLIGTVIIFLGIILSSKSSYASIEIVMGRTTLTNVTISQSYTYCQEMKNAGQALGRTSVVPHLATNLDWGAVSYLSNSIYGTNMAGGNTGTEITVNSRNYYSTNGNITGVLDWGKTYTQTSGLIQSYDPASSSAATNVATLYENKDTRFVDNVNTESFTVANTKGMGFKETAGWYSSWNYINWNNLNYPASFRVGLFSFSVGNGNRIRRVRWLWSHWS